MVAERLSLTRSRPAGGEVYGDQACQNPVLLVLFIQISQPSLKPWVVAQGIEIVVMLDPILHGAARHD